ncbi:MAG: DUF4279 domain-containing protein [Chloroflexota bacterium]
MDTSRDDQDEEADTRVWFSLYGDFDPEQITAMIGMAPTESAKAGELVSEKTNYRRPRSRWKIKSSMVGSVPLGEQVESILKTLEPRREKVAEVSLQYEAGFGCAVYIYDAQGPALHLESSIVERIAALHAYVDVDVYCLGGANCSGEEGDENEEDEEDKALDP